MTSIALVALGGAIGSVCRSLLSGAVHRFVPPTFPYGTFLVNTIGCLAFGLIVGVSEQRFVVGPSGRAFLLVGVLGGFTTFSTFAFESLELLRGGHVTLAAANVAGQVLAGLFGVWAGYQAYRVP